MSEVHDTLAAITDRIKTPVIVDADNGFGNALNTQRTVRYFERAAARSKYRTVRCVLSAFPNPLSASTITGVLIRSVMAASVSCTSDTLTRPMSERPKRV